MLILPRLLLPRGDQLWLVFPYFFHPISMSILQQTIPNLQSIIISSQIPKADEHFLPFAARPSNLPTLLSHFSCLSIPHSFTLLLHIILPPRWTVRLPLLVEKYQSQESHFSHSHTTQQIAGLVTMTARRRGVRSLVWFLHISIVEIVVIWTRFTSRSPVVLWDQWTCWMILCSNWR